MAATGFVCVNKNKTTKETVSKHNVVPGRWIRLCIFCIIILQFLDINVLMFLKHQQMHPSKHGVVIQKSTEKLTL